MSKKINYAFANIILQLIALYMNVFFGLMWPMYIIIILISILIVLQTVGLGTILSSMKLPELKDEPLDGRVGILVMITYGANCYQLYILGFAFFAGLAMAHVLIGFTVNFLRILK